MTLDLHRTRALAAHSIELIKAHQAPSGAFVASPSFSQYGYCWFRDGAFTAHAMSVAGEDASATRFHDWAASAVLRNAGVARDCADRARAGRPIDPRHTLRTRYPLSGLDEPDDWPNFQLDGFGTWLWAAIDHLGRTRDAGAAARWRPALAVVADYAAALWPVPNHDCWEEFGDRVHITTLAALHGGLRAAAAWLPSPEAARAAEDIRSHVLSHGVCDGHLRKFAGAGCEVDAALLGASTPYGLLSPDDPPMRATIAKIERDLRRPGTGVHRYAADTYYGGGEWILLTAWLGWHYARSGERDRAEACLAWVVAQAGDRLDLPEQVAHNLIDPARLPEWEARWGAVASPLLWSHAQFLIAWQAFGGLESARQ